MFFDKLGSALFGIPPAQEIPPQRTDAPSPRAVLVIPHRGAPRPENLRRLEQFIRGRPHAMDRTCSCVHCCINAHHARRTR
jgi:hypothetical protein